MLRHLLEKWLSLKEKKKWLWLLCKWMDFNLIYRKTTHFFKGIMSAWTQRNRGSREKPLNSQSSMSTKKMRSLFSIQFKTRLFLMEMKRKFRGWTQEPSLLVHFCHLQWHISSSLGAHLLSYLSPILLHWSLLWGYFFSVNRVAYPHKHLERQGLKDVAAESWGCRDTLHSTKVKAGWRDRRGGF